MMTFIATVIAVPIALVISLVILVLTTAVVSAFFPSNPPPRIRRLPPQDLDERGQ